MSLALFPNMGSSASVAVTWATVVPVGGGGVGGVWITKSELAQGAVPAVPVDREIKRLYYSPAGSVCLDQGGSKKNGKRGGESAGGVGEGSSIALSQVGTAERVRVTASLPHRDISLTIHLPLVFSPSHSNSVSPLYLSH